MNLNNVIISLLILFSVTSGALCQEPDSDYSCNWGSIVSNGLDDEIVVTWKEVPIV